jgi:glypican 4 (K-glypican)
MTAFFNALFLYCFRYLSCVSQTMKKLQPFGDVPKKLTEQLRRSFVATRTFAQALLQGKQVVNKILKVSHAALPSE